MASRLSDVLTVQDLPIAELSAARLDGELFAVGDAFSPSDTPEGTSARARSLLPILGGRLIVELLTAAWIFGAVDTVPSVNHLCSSSDARARPVIVRGMSVREVVIDDDEIVVVSGVKVTSPLRTACDLARSADTFGFGMQLAVVRLLELGSADLADCVDLLERRRNLPGKRRTLRRLRSLPMVWPRSAVADSIHVIHGVDPAHGVQHPVQVRGIAHLEHELAEGQPVG